MTHFFPKAAFAALLSLGAISATSTVANAGGVDVQIDIRGPGYHHGGGYYDGYDRGHYRPAYRPIIVYRPSAGRCSVGLALEKATWRGLHRARVTLVGSNRVVVEGRRGHYWDRIVFANVRGCPIIRR